MLTVFSCGYIEKKLQVEQLFLALSRSCLQFVIVVLLDHTHLLFLTVKFQIASNC